MNPAIESDVEVCELCERALGRSFFHVESGRSDGNICVDCRKIERGSWRFYRLGSLFIFMVWVSLLVIFGPIMILDAFAGKILFGVLGIWFCAVVLVTRIKQRRMGGDSKKRQR